MMDIIGRLKLSHHQRFHPVSPSLTSVVWFILSVKAQIYSLHTSCLDRGTEEKTGGRAGGCRG